ncbi:MAG: extracellular solute-binding protein [Lachnospiraceae bacterium]
MGRASGCNLDIQWVSYQDYDQKLNTLIAANSQPDVIQINKVNGNYYYPILTQAIDAGNFVDLTDYLFADGNGVAETNAVMKNWDENSGMKPNTTAASTFCRDVKQNRARTPVLK